MDLVLFGIQGSGKGTQAKILAEKYNFKIFETGHELRKLAQGDSELGQKIKSIIDAGNLVGNDTVMEIIENFMKDISQDQPVLFDGIPRHLVQKQTFDQLMENLNRDFIAVQILVPEDKTVARLIKRASEQNRADDTPEGIKKRIELFHQETVPAIKSYQEAGKLLTADGDQTVEEVTKNIQAVLEPHFPKP